MSSIMELLHQIYKLASKEGEAWRLEHPELMDAYAAVTEEIYGPTTV